MRRLTRTGPWLLRPKYIEAQPPRICGLWCGAIPFFLVWNSVCVQNCKVMLVSVRYNKNVERDWLDLRDQGEI